MIVLNAAKNQILNSTFIQKILSFYGFVCKTFPNLCEIVQVYATRKLQSEQGNHQKGSGGNMFPQKGLIQVYTSVEHSAWASMSCHLLRSLTTRQDFLYYLYPRGYLTTLHLPHLEMGLLS